MKELDISINEYKTIILKQSKYIYLLKHIDTDSININQNIKDLNNDEKK